MKGMGKRRLERRLEQRFRSPKRTPGLKALGGIAGILTALAILTPRLATGAPPARRTQEKPTAFPIKANPGRRYVVDRNGAPFLIVGDTPQGLMSRLTERDAELYFADRQAHGFNTAGWIDVACAGHDFAANTNAATPDGIRPFTAYLPGGTDYSHYDFRKPNETYFARLDHMVEIAARHDTWVFLDPMETIGWLKALENNGLAADFAYGRYLGLRYKRYPNVAWISGNDFNAWRNPPDDALALAVAKGIRSVAPDQIQTVELNVFSSSSFDDPSWLPLISLNSTYTYSPTYMQMLHSYNQRPVAPAYLVEAHYDLENVGKPPDFGTPAVLRREEYWTMLSGGSGQFYGNAYTWSFKSGWQSHLDTPGVAQLMLWKRFFTAIPWQDLVPDQNHSVLLSGSGEYGTMETPVSRSEYAAAARTADGAIVAIYMPTSRAIRVNMAALRAPASAQWFDPVDGLYSKAASGPVANVGSRSFTPPGKNHAGDGDWVLLLTAGRKGHPGA